MNPPTKPAVVSSAPYRIRAAAGTDVPALLGLMRELAAFERYLPHFAVTEAELLARGFPATGKPEYFARVADGGESGLLGYAVYYFVSFTYDLKPTLVLKELYVRSTDRSLGLGAALFENVQTEAQRFDCGQIKWAVLPDNLRAKEFYRRQGGTPDKQWEWWCRPVK
jgi:ribosomal protein S18 acetylase RimI-like enzyme